MLRRLIRHSRTQAVLACLMASYLRLVERTTRWTVLGQDHVDAAIGPGEAADAPRRAAVIAFWHERLALMPLGLDIARQRLPGVRKARVHVLVSRHRDGKLIGDIGRRFDLRMIHASTSRGGAAGMRAMLRLLAEGEDVAITPDGPRGPRRQAAPGVAQLAALSGRPVLPCSAATSRARLLRSWDRMHLPLPFGRGVVVVGPPLRVPREAPETHLPAIEAALSEACDRADALVARGGAVAAREAAPA